ncbi:hypothetical protein HOLleu_44655 [Holothuria leucospilota]|uniref:Helix-turn-helix domain-containing protein n=1 Tax=Holothuria leucospilota TaxID=206669 RepID=A0A9Q0YFL2_HOLLE|nr:hypothetical protein HOLleu_44655 [Holothuria leucospilota]
MYPSNHPRSCTNSIPFSQLLRARRICSDDQDFAQVSKQIISFFEQRQYPQRVLSNALKRIQGIDRASALAPKTDHTPTRRIPLVLSFHPSVNPIVRAIYRNVETLRHDTSTPVTEHLRSIKQNLPGFPVATHFNPPSTCSIRDLMVSAAISCRGSDHDRLAAENRLIMKLGTLSPHGLNVRLELL